MRSFIGTKIVNAKPLNKGDYNKLRGWDMPVNEDPSEPGYLVEYQDSPNKNHPDYDNYISWSPASVFEGAYHPAEDEYSFDIALNLVKIGLRMQRKGWNGKGMFIFLVDGSTFTVNRPPLLGIYPEGTEINYHAHIDMRTADGQIVPWLCSQTDMLANDWVLYKEPAA